MSIADKPEDSFAKLKSAWAKGFRPVCLMQQDRDLKNLRSKKSVDFAELVKVRNDEKISYGYVWNNFELTNRSEFALTFPFVKVTWAGKDGSTYTEIYCTKSIDPSATFSFKGALPEASQRNESKWKVSVLCDENRSVQHINVKDIAHLYNGRATYMSADGANVKATRDAQLRVTDAGNEFVRLELTVNGTAVCDLKTTDTLRDGVAVVALGSDRSHRMRFCFSGSTAYGFCQSREDSDTSYVLAFWGKR